MISHRVADNRLGPVKDDLLLALRRIQLNLETYREDSRDPAPLEAIIEAISQIRGPLVVLDHREAVAFLEEMHAIIQDRAAGPVQTFDPMLLRRATEHLADYLQVCLSPGNRRPDADLAKMRETLRQARQQCAVSTTDATVPAADATAPALQEILKRLQHTLAVQVDGSPDQSEPWEALRGDLQILQGLLAERNWPRAALALGRLDRIVGILATGAAEHYGLLVSGVCAEILAGLGYGLELEPSDGDGPAAAALNAAEEHLAQMETLLRLSPFEASPVSAPTPAVPQPAPAAGAARAALAPPDAISSLTLELAEWSEPATPAEPVPAPADEGIAIESLNLDLTPPPAMVAEPVSPPTAARVEPDEVARAENRAPADLGNPMALIGLADSDPEFIEVFLEEACGELATIREQLAIWRAHPDDHQVLATLRRSFHTLKGSGRMVGATMIGDFAWEYEDLLNQVLNGARPPSPAIIAAVAAAAEALAPLVGEVPLRGGELAALPALVEQARALRRAEPEPVAPPSSLAIAPGIDPEFIEVFLEEAHGELATIREQLAGWRRNLADRQVLTTLRRAFHTLKGSGRVVGATVIGDFAWHFENLLNQILNLALAATPAVVNLVGEAADALELLVGEALAVNEDALATLNRLAARVEALLQEPPGGVVPTPVEPVAGEATPPVGGGSPRGAGAGPGAARAARRGGLPGRGAARRGGLPGHGAAGHGGNAGIARAARHGTGIGADFPVRSRRNSRCQRCHPAAVERRAGPARIAERSAPGHAYAQRQFAHGGLHDGRRSGSRRRIGAGCLG